MPDERLDDAEAQLAEGETHAALNSLRFALGWPGPSPGTPEWRRGWELFARVAAALGDEELPELLEEAERIDDVVAWGNVGWQLNEVGLHRPAATALQYANALGGEERVELVTEYAHALECSGRNDAARDMLLTTHAADREFIVQYLVAFNSIAAGDIDTARTFADRFEPGEDFESPMADRIVRMIARHDAVANVTALDHDDLRGWHYVLHGGILTHVSPFGEDSMRGRYAFFQEQAPLVVEGLHKLRAVLEAWDVAPASVSSGGDRDSDVLGRAVASFFDVPFFDLAAPVPDDALVAVYDLRAADEDRLEEIAETEGHVLWCHAECWTEVPPYAADVGTYQFQTTVPPWGETMIVDPESRDVSHGEPDERPPEEIADELLDAEPEYDDLDAVRTLAEAAAAAPSKGQPPSLRRGERERFWDSSPVESARFA